MIESFVHEPMFIFLLNCSSGIVIVFQLLLLVCFSNICRCYTAQAWLGALTELLSSLVTPMEQLGYGRLVSSRLATIFNRKSLFSFSDVPSCNLSSVTGLVDLGGI